MTIFLDGQKLEATPSAGNGEDEETIRIESAEMMVILKTSRGKYVMCGQYADMLPMTMQLDGTLHLSFPVAIQDLPIEE